MLLRAEIIPFLKTYVNLPGAIGFTVLYSKLTNKCAAPDHPTSSHRLLSPIFRVSSRASAPRYSRKNVFYICIWPFIAFFALFATFIYPNSAMFHPHVLADAMAAVLPAGFAAPIAIIRCASG